MGNIRRINIFSPPCAGKTILAMELTAELKKAGIEIEPKEVNENRIKYNEI